MPRVVPLEVEVSAATMVGVSEQIQTVTSKKIFKRREISEQSENREAHNVFLSISLSAHGVS